MDNEKDVKLEENLTNLPDEELDNILGGMAVKGCNNPEEAVKNPACAGIRSDK